MKTRIKTILILTLSLLPLTQVNALTPNDPLYPDQWYIPHIEADATWEILPNDNQTIVAVIDTGIDFNHEDIKSRIYANPNESENSGRDKDRNGYINDIHGWDFVDDDQDPFPTIDENEPTGTHHGTAVASIIAAEINNAKGMAGVSNNVKIMPLRALSKTGEAFMEDIVDAIDYAVDNGAKVINISFIGNEDSRLLNDALQRAYDNDVTVIAAMGNNADGGEDLDNTKMFPVCSPGNAKDNVVIGVVSTTQSDKRAEFSNYGSACADISAPGTNMTVALATTDFSGKYDNLWQGTSLSAPIVSGAIATMKSKYTNATPSELLLAIQLSADPIARDGQEYMPGALGSGRINVKRAIETLPKLIAKRPKEWGEKPEDIEELKDEGTKFVPLAVGAGPGDPPVLTLFDVNGFKNSWNAYAEQFKGGVNVAIGILDNKGYSIVTGPGEGGGPHIRVFDELGNIKAQFFAFDESYSGGVDVAIGDVTGDGNKEIIVVPGKNHDPVVRVFTPTGELIKELDIDSTGAPLRVTAGNLDASNADEIIVSEYAGGESTVRVYWLKDNLRVASYQAYALLMDRGVSSAVMPLEDRGIIYSGTGPGAGPHIRSFDRTGDLYGQFFAFDSENRAGVDVTVWEPYLDGQYTLVVSSVENGLPTLKVLNYHGEPTGININLSGYTQRVSL